MAQLSLEMTAWHIYIRKMYVSFGWRESDPSIVTAFICLASFLGQVLGEVGLNTFKGNLEDSNSKVMLEASFRISLTIVSHGRPHSQ